MRTGVLAGGLIALHIVGCAAGGVLGYGFAMKRLKARYDEELAAEVLATKKFYAIMNKDGVVLESLSEKIESSVEVPETVKVVLDKYAGRTEKIQYHRPVEKSTSIVTSNIFADVAEVENPVLITEEEFEENGPEYTMASLTYYEGDNVLSDQADEVVDIKDVGAENLQHFGEGEWDPNILYVMNKRIEHLFEINLSSGKFSVEVLGLEG